MTTPPPDKPKERSDAYYYALGRFVHVFARVELATHTVLRHYAKMTQDSARALLSGVRVTETRDRLKRLYEVGFVSQAEWDDLTPTLTQLGEITNRRNDTLHHGAIGITEEIGSVTNAAMAMTRERVTGFAISPAILDAMTHDLRKILIHLRVNHTGLPPLGVEQSEIDAILQEPWRYTLQSSRLVKPHKAERPPGTTKPTRPGQAKPPHA